MPATTGQVRKSCLTSLRDKNKEGIEVGGSVLVSSANKTKMYFSGFTTFLPIAAALSMPSSLEGLAKPSRPKPIARLKVAATRRQARKRQSILGFLELRSSTSKCFQNRKQKSTHRCRFIASVKFLSIDLGSCAPSISTTSKRGSTKFLANLGNYVRSR